MATLRTPITAPPATPPRYSLIRAAADAGLSTDALYHGWAFNPEVCGGERGGIVAVDCIGSFDDPVAHPGNPAQVLGDAFAVWASDSCSTFGFAARDWQGRARRMLAAVESYWLARAFAGEGALALTQTTLNDAGATTLGGGAATPPAVALAILEDALGEALRGQPGMIHVTEAVLVLLVADNVVRLDNTLWRTPMGNIVVVDAGYTGAGPGDTEADLTPGESWMYGTSLVAVSLGPVDVIPESAAEAGTPPGGQWTDRGVNTAELFAARLATWVWDGCAHLAVNVDTTAVSGGGGGDPAPDYTALLAAISAATSDTDTNTDALEALVTALGTNTDGLETLVAATNTALGTITTALGDVDVNLESIEALTAAPQAVEDVAYPATGHTGLVIVGRRSDTPAASGADGDAIDPVYDGLGAQWVHPVKTSETIKTTIAGMSNAAYAINEQVGTEITVAGASRLAGWGGVLGKVTVVDDLLVFSGNTASFDVYLFDVSVTGATDNNTFDDTDADMASLVDIIRFTDADKRAHTSNAVYTRSGLSIPYTCVATSLFAIVVARTALASPAGFSSATALRLNFGVLLD